MRSDIIDRALREDRTLVPSRGFAFRVMRSVRRQAAERRALPFPWPPLAAGLAATAALTVAGLVAAGAGGGTPTGAGAPVSEALVQLAPAVAWLTTALVGSFGLTWWSLRLAGKH